MQEMASNAENVSIWRHHGEKVYVLPVKWYFVKVTNVLPLIHLKFYLAIHILIRIGKHIYQDYAYLQFNYYFTEMGLKISI